MKSADEHKLRAYRALATAFYFPSPDLSSVVQELRDALASLGVNLFEEDLSTLEMCLAENKAVPELVQEYCKLFYGPAKLLAPPYESIYRDGGVTMGESTLSVIKAYSEAGVAVSQDFKNLPDHVAAELEFMYYLCAKEVEAFKKEDLRGARHYLLLQKLFLKEHLTQWLPQFSKRVEENGTNDVYPRFARIAAGFAEIDANDTTALKELTHAIRLLDAMGK